MTETTATYTTAYYDLTSAALGEIENLFCACAFINPQYAIDTCGWLKGKEISNNDLRRFWQNLNGKFKGDGSGAALEAGVFNRLAKYTAQVPSSLDVVSYGREIQRRNYLLSTDPILGELMHARQSNDVDRMRSLITKLNEASPDIEQGLPTPVDIALEFCEYLDNLGNCINTGIACLDAALGGYEMGTFNLLAARPSMGKSTLAFQIARNLTGPLSRRVLLFSNEMTRVALWKKAACGLAGLDWRDVKNNRATPEQLEALRTAATDLAAAMEDRLIIDDRRHHTTETIWPIVAKLRPDLVIVDVIANLKDKADRRQEKLSNIALNLRDMAYQCKLPVLGLHHIARAAEENKGEGNIPASPTMSNLADSSDLEKHADTILIMHSPDYYQTNKKFYSATDITIAKNREGVRNGIVHLAFDLKKQWFSAIKEAGNDGQS